MASLKNLKTKITGIKKTSKVTKAMESISAIKMRYAQKEALDGRDYTFFVFGLLKRLSKVAPTTCKHGIFAPSVKSGKNTVIFLTSPDRGLTGGMNNFLFKKVEQVIKRNNLTKDNLSFVCVGKRGYEYVSKKGYKVEKYFEDVYEKTPQKEMEVVSNLLLDLYKNKEKNISNVISVYTNFKNTSEQKATSHIILPVIFDEIKLFVKRILPTKGKYAHLEKIDIDNSDISDYLYEPSMEKVVMSLIPFVLNVSVFYSLLESFASEHSARMVAMKNSTDRANELSEKFRRKYNKERQAQVTSEISEIISGVEAMKK